MEGILHTSLGPASHFRSSTVCLLCPLPSPGCHPAACPVFVSTALWPTGTLPLGFEPLSTHLKCSCLYSSCSLPRLLNLHSPLNSNSSVVCKASLVTTVCRRETETQTAMWGMGQSLALPGGLLPVGPWKITEPPRAVSSLVVWEGPK